MLVLLAASVLIDRLNSAASIPTIRSAETAVSLAEASGLTLVGFLRGRGLNVYGARQRVAGAT